jgi:hypothetical protein
MGPLIDLCLPAAPAAVFYFPETVSFFYLFR